MYNWPNLGEPEVSLLGREIFRYTGDSPCARAVRARRDRIAGMIDRLADRVESPHVLSVACGHMREAPFARAVRARRLGRYVALDQDAESLEVVDRELAPYGVETVRESVMGILRQRLDVEGFDFIYSAGLYDYLSDPVARRLTELFYAKLNPGGKLLIANFRKGIRDAGFMEAFLDWFLVYRNPDELETLCESIPRGGTSLRRTFVDEKGVIGFLEITKTS